MIPFVAACARMLRERSPILTPKRAVTLRWQLEEALRRAHEAEVRARISDREALEAERWGREDAARVRVLERELAAAKRKLQALGAEA